MKAVVLFSGGLDSSVLLAKTVAKYGREEVLTLGVDYGQRHVKELAAAEVVRKVLGVTNGALVSIRGGLLLHSMELKAPMGGSSQTEEGIAVPEGHYADESMKATFVPNRNMVMISLAASFALANGADEVHYAAHAGDHAIYPDCRPEFVDFMNHVLTVANYSPVRVVAPFIGMTKAEVVGEGAQLGVPFDLTWSCYQGLEVHCGKCGTCVERREAFQLAGVKDPTEYAG